MSEPFFRKVLQEELDKRKRSNSNYSLRAFAKYLGLQPAVLSFILRGERKLPRKYIETVCQKLDLDFEDRKKFIDSIMKERVSLRKLSNIDLREERVHVLKEKMAFEILAHWQYQAILALIDVKEFKDDFSWIAKRLGISEQQAQKCYQDLFDQELLIRKEGKVVKRAEKPTAIREIQKKAQEQAQKESLELAMSKMSTPFDCRDYSSATVAIDPSRLPEAKELIRDFKKRLSQFLGTGLKQDVYRLSIQLYPLSETES